MMDHVGIGAFDLRASRAFFVEALAPLGITVQMEVPHAVGLGKDGKPFFWLSEAGCKPSSVHLAFAAQSREQVDAFHAAALKAGGRDNGAPGLRPHYHASYYAAFVYGPDGHNVEAVCHAPPA